MATGASTSRSHFGHRSNPTVADVVSSCALMDFGRFLCPSYFFRGIDHRCWMSVLKVPWKKGASGTSGTSDPSGSLHGQWTPNERWSDPQGDPVRSGQILFSILLQHCLHTSPWALHESQPNSMDGILILDFQVMNPKDLKGKCVGERSFQVYGCQIQINRSLNFILLLPPRS